MGESTKWEFQVGATSGCNRPRIRTHGLRLRADVTREALVLGVVIREAPGEDVGVSHFLTLEQARSLGQSLKTAIEQAEDLEVSRANAD